MAKRKMWTEEDSKLARQLFHRDRFSRPEIVKIIQAEREFHPSTIRDQLKVLFGRVRDFSSHHELPPIPPGAELVTDPDEILGYNRPLQGEPVGGGWIRLR